jgi:hypothetical protein
MAAAVKHIVKTLCFETRVASEDSAHAFADKIKSIDAEHLLSKILSKYDHLPGIIRIDQLDLDIGTIDPGDLDNLEELITTQLEEILADKLVHIDSNGTNWSFTRKEEMVNTPETIESKTEILLHYLLTGSLPWHVNGKPDMEELLLEMLEKETAPVKRLIGAHLNKTIVTKRLAAVFHLSTIELLAESITSKVEYATVKKIIALLIKQLSPTGPDYIRKELAAIILKSLRESFKQQKEYSLLFIHELKTFLSSYPVHSLQSLMLAVEHLILSAPDITSRQVYTSLFEKIQQLTARQQSPVEGITPPVGESSAKANNDSIKLPVDVQEEVNTDKETAPAQEEEVEEDRYFIDNAGIVLLNAGLLQKYFEQLGWVKNRAIVDKTASHKMMVWLDWLVWGDHKVHEYGLLLNKILVGLELSDICDIHVSLSGHEKVAGQEFLETIIHHWSILKNTSIAGLRTTFLQRAGRLANEDGGWQLHTEAKSYDILIDSLPWSFSIIKFPWMTKPLFTQWPTKI